MGSSGSVQDPTVGAIYARGLRDAPGSSRVVVNHFEGSTENGICFLGKLIIKDLAHFQSIKQMMSGIDRVNTCKQMSKKSREQE